MLEDIVEPVPDRTAPTDNRKTLLLAIAALTALFFARHFLRDVLPQWVNIGEGTINVYGLMIFLSMFAVFHFTFKKILSQSPGTSIVYLIAIGCITVLFSELIFQSYVFVAANYSVEQRSGGLVYFLRNILLQPVISLVIAVPMAVQMKLKSKLLGAIVGFAMIGLFWYLVVYLKLFEEMTPKG
jgi:hypothetical protein